MFQSKRGKYLTFGWNIFMYSMSMSDVASKKRTEASSSSPRSELYQRVLRTQSS